LSEEIGLEEGRSICKAIEDWDECIKDDLAHDLERIVAKFPHIYPQDVNGLYYFGETRGNLEVFRYLPLKLARGLFYVHRFHTLLNNKIHYVVYRYKNELQFAGTPALQRFFARMFSGENTLALSLPPVKTSKPGPMKKKEVIVID
jgi:hypothetical protein